MLTVRLSVHQKSAGRWGIAGLPRLITGDSKNKSASTCEMRKTRGGGRGRRVWDRRRRLQRRPRMLFITRANKTGASERKRWQEVSSKLDRQGLGPRAEDAVSEDDTTRAKVVAPESEAPKVKMTDKKASEEAPVRCLTLEMGYRETRCSLRRMRDLSQYCSIDHGPLSMCCWSEV